VSTIGTGVINCQVCVCANGKTSAHLKSVFKMSTVCSNASLLDVDATAWPLHRWPPGGNVPTLQLGATLAGRRHESMAAVHTLLQLHPNLVVDWVRSGLLAGHKAGVMFIVYVITSFVYVASTRHFRTPECLPALQYVTLHGDS